MGGIEVPGCDDCLIIVEEKSQIRNGCQGFVQKKVGLASNLELAPAAGVRRTRKGGSNEPLLYWDGF
jgi:hypothetical protein